MKQRKRRIANAFSHMVKPDQFFAAPGITIRAKKNEHRIVSDMLGDASHGKRALDAGCGIGSYTDILMQKGYDVVGIDIASGMAEFCRLKYKGEVGLAIADIEYMPFKEMSFDLVFCIDTLCYFDHEGRRAVVEGLVGLLRPGGTIICDVKNKYCPAFMLKRYGRGNKVEELYTTRGITDVLKESGCENIQTKGVLFHKVLSPIVVVKAKKTAEG